MVDCLFDKSLDSAKQRWKEVSKLIFGHLIQLAVFRPAFLTLLEDDEYAPLTGPKKLDGTPVQCLYEHRPGVRSRCPMINRLKNRKLMTLLVLILFVLWYGDYLPGIIHLYLADSLRYMCKHVAA